MWLAEYSETERKCPVDVQIFADSTGIHLFRSTGLVELRGNRWSWSLPPAMQSAKRPLDIEEDNELEKEGSAEKRAKM